MDVLRLIYELIKFMFKQNEIPLETDGNAYGQKFGNFVSAHEIV